MRYLIVLVLLIGCGRPLDSFCVPAEVIEKDHRQAYSYVTLDYYTTYVNQHPIRRSRLRTVYVPEKNYVTFQSARSREVINDKYWFTHTAVGRQEQACYTNYEYKHLFDDGRDTTARFTQIAPHLNTPLEQP